MRVLVISATLCLASAASAVAGALRDNDIIVVTADETPSRGISDEPKLYLPIIARGDEDCWPSVRLIVEDLPRPPKTLVERLPARGYVHLHNKHDYG